MPPASSSAILDLIVRDEWRGRPGDVLRAFEQGAALDAFTADERALGAAAAALGAGEPKRAARLLEGSTPTEYFGTVAAALRGLAWVFDSNWFPGGGAVLEPSDLARMPVAAQAATGGDVTGVDRAELLFVVTRLLSPTPTWRSLARSSVAGVALQSAMETLQQAMTTSLPRAVGPAALTLADLFARAGQVTQANAPLGIAMQMYTSVEDAAGLGACSLAQGDWSAGPLSQPEALGEDLEGRAPGTPQTVEPDLAFAAQCYDAATEHFRTAGAPRGVAAVELRRARLLATAGEHDGALDALERARAGAEEAGDGALVRLTMIHAALVRLDQGDHEPEVEATDAVVEWAVRDGSTSFARGLSRLCHAKARRWREEDRLEPARAALDLADRINRGIGATSEPDLVRSELVALYGGANYRSAALTLSLLDLHDGREGAPAQLDDIQWARAVERCVGANGDAVALADPDLIERVEADVRLLLEHEPSPPDATDGTTVTATGVNQFMRATLEQIVAENQVLVPLYRGRRARDEGEQAVADAHFERALAAATELAPEAPLLRAVVLGTMGRRDEAVPIVEQMQLPPDLAASLYVRLRRFDLALRAVAALDAAGPQVSERPWETPALRAAALLGADRTEEALAQAEIAIAAFEDHLARLSRDVLRTMATDDVGVADLYTTGVHARVKLALAGDAAARTQLAAAFELSDRCRGSSLAELVDLDRVSGAGEEATALRRWLGAGAALGRTIESAVGLAAGDSESAAVRDEIAAAERALDDAELAIARIAPNLLGSRRRLPATPSLDDVQSALDPESLLVQYHAYDDRVVTWAVSRSEASVSEQELSTAKLQAQVASFHRATASPRSTADERAALGSALAEVLLAPSADALQKHRCVVIVPHGVLAMLPFHVLPFADDFLCTTHVVSYVPAASLLVERRPRAQVLDRSSVLVVGDPAYADDRHLPRLPGARTEALAIAALYGSEPLVDGTAVRQSVLERLDSANVVHLATHGLLRAGAPYSAELALAGDDSLTIPDLMAADTSIDLAVLSACDSGRGGATASGDLIGLTRALIVAGANELVVSLWPVDDQIACLTMTRFHEELGGAPPADALGAAQRAMRTQTREEADAAYASLQGETATAGAAARRTARDLPVRDQNGPPSVDPAHPAFWAPFVHIGG